MNIASIVLCAGKSTRFKSGTSKILHPLCGKPMFAWALDALAPLKGQIVAVIGHQAELVQSEIQKRSPSVSFAVQSEQKGTGHAVQTAMQQLTDFNGTILVMCGDTPVVTSETLKKLVTLRKSAHCNVAMLTTLIQEPTGYGRIIRNSDGTVNQIVEELEASGEQQLIKEINVGIYAFDGQFLRESLANLKPSPRKNEYYLTDVVQSSSAFSISIPSQEAMGINDRIQMAQAERVLRRRINEHWMREGVTCVDFKNTYIDSDVTLEADVVLEPGVQLRGQTSIASNVRIGAGSIITDSKIASNAVIHPYSICENATIGEHAQVGPFARLRPETVLDEKVKIGNFVEVKKSHFHSSAKANHLAYIGDATVGERSNVGAGTITCNYDGFKKHKTLIGDDVFVGSNSTLVAPIKIEPQAYVAAGSTLTQDVPSDALAIARGRQENKTGYAKRIRDRLK